MDAQQPPRRIPKIPFRVLIIGRANAGKTTILQRICDTTESPTIYRRDSRRKRKVTLGPSMDRGEHSIDDELIFSNHEGYVFHDSRGIESGSTDELGIIQDFILRMCGQRQLRDRLHAIWYCVPMDNQRPQLDLKFFKDICPDRNVPVIAVFTKYDQFRRNVQIYVEDFGSPDDSVSDVAERQFQENYLRLLGDEVRFVRLEQMHRQNMRCDRLIETTAAALNDDIVRLMLLAVQTGNLELSVKTALSRVRSRNGMETKDIVRECLVPFPYIWFFSMEPKILRPFLLERRLQLEDRLFREDDPKPFELPKLRRFFRKFFPGSDRFVEQIMSLPTIQNLTATSLSGYHLILAVLLILKHATLLRLSNMSPQSALTHAEVDYREANMDSRVRQHLTAPSQEQSDELFAGFIMSTDVTCTHAGVAGDGGR